MFTLENINFPLIYQDILNHFIYNMQRVGATATYTSEGFYHHIYKEGYTVGPYVDL